MPIDADLGDERFINVISPLAFGKALIGAEHRLVILDNCRNHLDGGRRAAREEKNNLPLMPGSANTLLLQQPNVLWLSSTQPGYIALDGPAGQNSPFATALMRELAEPSVDLTALPGKLRRAVLLATEGQQLTYDLSTMTAPLSLAATGKPPARNSAPGADLSRVIELNNTYAFAEKNGLYLPAGLIAYRPPNGSPDAHMVGGYAGESRVSVGTSIGGAVVLTVFIVISNPGSDTFEVVLSSKHWSGSIDGPYWKYVTAAKTGDKLVVPGFGARAYTELRWRDRDPATLTDVDPERRNSRSPSPLKRLDG